jgi:DNA-directed RNA polymerase III subunit RPC2
MCLFGFSSVSVSLFPLFNMTYSQALDEDGIAAPGQIIRNHDVYVNKQVPSVTTGRRGAGALLNDR